MQSINLNKRLPPTKAGWRLFQSQNYHQKLKALVDDEMFEATRVYKQQKAAAKSGHSQDTDLKKPERIQIMNRMAQDMYRDMEKAGEQEQSKNRDRKLAGLKSDRERQRRIE